MTPDNSLPRPAFINYPRAQALLWTLGHVFRRQSDKPHLVVSSPPNNGLTTILGEFEARQRARLRASEEVTPHPVIVSPAPPEFEEDRVLNMILLAVGAPISTGRRNANPRRRQALTLLKTIGTRMLILDHAAHLWPERPHARRTAVDLLLELARATDTRVVIAGFNQAPPLDANGPFAAAVLPRWSQGKDYEQVVEQFSAAYGLRIQPDRHAAIAAALHAATHGLLGALSALLRLYARAQGPVVTEAGLAALDWAPPGTLPAVPAL